MKHLDPYDFIAGNLEDRCRIINEAEFHRASVLIPFIWIEGEWHILLERRAGHIRQGGEVSLPGGGVEEQDKTSAETALREAREELGLTPDQIDLAGFLGTFVGTMGVLIDAYIGRLFVDDNAGLPFNRDEVEDLFFVPFRFFLETEPDAYTAEILVRSISYNDDGTEKVLFPAKELGLPERYHSAWNTKPHKIYVYPTTPYTLWGITAKILRHLAEWYKNLTAQDG